MNQPGQIRNENSPALDCHTTVQPRLTDQHLTRTDRKPGKEHEKKKPNFFQTEVGYNLAQFLLELLCYMFSAAAGFHD